MKRINNSDVIRKFVIFLKLFKIQIELIHFNNHRAVDSRILTLLKDRLHHCIIYHGRDDAILCEKIREDANNAEYNFELKCMYFLFFFVNLNLICPLSLFLHRW